MPERHALLLHGAGGGGWEWNLWDAAWRAHGLHVHAPDLQPSPRGLAATQWTDYADQAVAWLARLPRPRVLVGASLGGLLALQAASHADAVILVNPLPPAPWQAHLPERDWPAVVPWARQARLASTRRAMPDADEAAVIYALRRWRDESGAVLRQAHAGIMVPPPACPILLVVSRDDEDVPPVVSRTLARHLAAEVIEVPGSHVGPLLGRHAAGVAAQALAWLEMQAPAG